MDIADFPHPRCWRWGCNGPYERALLCCSISSLPATTTFRNGNCRFGRVAGCNNSPNHAQQPYQWKTWLCERCSCECGLDQCFASRCMSPDANKASTATEGRQLHSCPPSLVDRSCLYLCMYMVGGQHLLTRMTHVTLIA